MGDAFEVYAVVPPPYAAGVPSADRPLATLGGELSFDVRGQVADGGPPEAIAPGRPPSPRDYSRYRDAPISVAATDSTSPTPMMVRTSEVGKNDRIEPRFGNT